MPTYVALLRGIMPTNPNMKSAKLKAAFEELGFKNVRTVIASGNVVFDSPSKDIAALEHKIEAALPKKLGFSSTTIVRSAAEIEQLIHLDPFKKIKNPKLYLVVTFLKTPSQKTLPKKGEAYEVVGTTSREIFIAVETDKVKTPDVMRVAEATFGKEITTRTWKTVGRIMAKMLD